MKEKSKLIRKVAYETKLKLPKSTNLQKLIKNGGMNTTMTTTRQIVKPSQSLLQIARKFKERIFEIMVNLKNVHKYRKKFSRSKKNHHLSQLRSSYNLFVVNTKILYKLYSDAINNSRTLLGGKSKYGKLKGSGIFFDSKNDKAFTDIQRLLQLSYELLSNPTFLQDKNKVLEKFVTVLDNIHKFNYVLKDMFIKLNQGNIVKELPSIPKLNNITSQRMQPETKLQADATIKPAIKQPATIKPATIKPSIKQPATIKQPDATIKPATIITPTIKQSAARQTSKVLSQPTPSNPVVQIVKCSRCNTQYKLTRTDDKDLLFNCSQCGTQIKATYKDTQTQMPSNRTTRQNQQHVRFETNNYTRCMSKCRNQCSRTNLSTIKEG
jgi:DNA-directed RNA polymerase subunit RPC12/RpoP